MENNTTLVNTDPRNIAIASETASLIKAAIAENTQSISASTQRPNKLVIRSNPIRCPVSELHHRLARGR